MKCLICGQPRNWFGLASPDQHKAVAEKCIELADAGVDIEAIPLGWSLDDFLGCTPETCRAAIKAAA